MGGGVKHNYAANIWGGFRWGVLGGVVGKQNLPITKHNLMSLNQPESVLYVMMKI